MNSKKPGKYLLLLIFFHSLTCMTPSYALSPRAKAIHEKGAKKLKKKALEDASGVSTSIPDKVPDSFKHTVGNFFGEDLGDGRFTLLRGDASNFLRYITFNFTIQTSCSRLAVREISKTFRFLKGPPGTFQRVTPPSGDPETQNPPTNPNNNTQEPGEINGGSGSYNFYDIPGPTIFPPGQMPPAVRAEKIRLVNKFEIYCVDNNKILFTNYWIAEFIVIYENGTANLGASTSSFRPITANEYNDAANGFGQDH